MIAAKSLRLAVELPVPALLSDYHPFTPMQRYGVRELTGDKDQTVKIEQKVRQAFAAGATIGFCQVPSVKAIFFDMDATVIVEESIVELARAAGTSEAVAQITNRAMAGEIDFAAALAERVALLKGLPENILTDVLARLTLSRGIRELIGFCNKIGVPAFLISGGFMQLAEPLARELGFAGVKANTLGLEGGRLTGRVEGEVIDAAAKRSFLLAQCARLQIDPHAVAAVGDGANDILMLEVAGVAIGHKPKAILRSHIHGQNASGDHTFLGPLLFGRDVAAG